MERKARQTLNTILGWVGYGLGYSEDHNVALTGRQSRKGTKVEAEHEITAARVVAIAKEISDLHVLSADRQIVLTQLALAGEPTERARETAAAQVTEAVQEIADLRTELAEHRESAEQVREAAAAKVTEVTGELADLGAQLAGLNDSAERGREAAAAKVTEVTGELADLRTQLAELREPTERAREATPERVNEVVQEIADLDRQWADLRHRIEQPGDGSEPELRARPEKPGSTASSQPETPSASPIERGGGPVSIFGPPSSENPSAGFDGDGANASSFFRWPSLLAFPNSLATHMPRFLTRLGRQNTEALSESVGRPPERAVPVAVERLRGMVRSDTVDIAPVTVAFDEPPDEGGHGGSGMQCEFNRSVQQCPRVYPPASDSRVSCGAGC